MMRGFEAEWAEIDEVRTAYAELLEKVRAAATLGQPTRKHVLSHPDTKGMDPLVVDLVCLLDDAERLFDQRRDAVAYERIEHVVATHRHPVLSTMRILEALVWELSPAHVIEHMLYAENEAHPEYRDAAQKRRVAVLARRWQDAFHAHGLDGVALGRLLAIKPGPGLGQQLKEIQAFAKGERAELPDVPLPARETLLRAVDGARAMMAAV